MLTFLTGFIASVAHVVTGPDHLAAVTPLAIDSRKRSWKVGLSWGMGHTLGMLLIGALFLLFKDLFPVEAVSRHSETIIGVMLIAIGSWAIARTWVRHTHGNRPHTHFHTKPFLYAHMHKHTHEQAGDSHIPEGDDHDHEHAGPSKHHALTALFIGIIHGFAGFSHLVALLPSLALPSMAASVIYLSAFAAGTILTMVFFAVILGLVAYRSAARQRQVFLKWFTYSGGVLAIGIGILWLINPI
jgi:ABC-type nickel/cobalt efflux system permease component RcnA